MATQNATTPVYARQAIVTKYHGPTDTRGSRVTAKCDAGRITVPWNDALNLADNHAAAVAALVARLAWDASQYTRNGAWHLGSLPGGGYCAVYCMDGSQITLATKDGAR